VRVRRDRRTRTATQFKPFLPRHLLATPSLARPFVHDHAEPATTKHVPARPTGHHGQMSGPEFTPDKCLEQISRQTNVRTRIYPGQKSGADFTTDKCLDQIPRQTNVRTPHDPRQLSERANLPDICPTTPGHVLLPAIVHHNPSTHDHPGAATSKQDPAQDNPDSQDKRDKCLEQNLRRTNV